MRKIAIAGFMAAVLAVSAVLGAQDAPGLLASTKEHAWLHQHQVPDR